MRRGRQLSWREVSPGVMKPRPTASPQVRSGREIAAEMEDLFQKQIELLKSESFVGLTVSPLAEYDKIGQRIRELFQELQIHLSRPSDPA